MTVYITESQNSTYFASVTGEEWILDTGIGITTEGIAFDAAGAATNQNFIVKGDLISDDGPFFRIGQTGVSDVASAIKFDYLCAAVSNGAGFIALSGGLDILNVGSLTSTLTLFEFNGSEQKVENSGSMESLASGAFAVLGDGFSLDNNSGVIKSYGTAVSVSGNDAEINNNADVLSSAGGGIRIEGGRARVENNKLISAHLDAVVVIGDDAEVINNLDILSVAGMGIRIEGRDLQLENNGTIEAGGDGISILGDGYHIVNHKQVKAAGIGLRLDGNGVVLTQDGISGQIAILVEAGMAEITNTNVLQSSSKRLAAVVGSDEGLAFTNLALVHAKSGIVLQGGASADIVDNRGWLDGIVRLGGGDDIFLGTSGRVSGIIHGDDGDDLYVINNSLRVKEARAQGVDTVQCVDSYRLGKNFENLVLLGGDPTTGTGNRLNNSLKGNFSDNSLFGHKGQDSLDGGMGNDLLSGNAGKDIFIFAPGSGVDRIMDFVRGEDRISLAAFEGMDSIAGVRDHLLVTRRNAVIELEDDRLIIVGGADIRFQADDFIL